MLMLGEAVSGWASFRVLFDWETLEGWEPAAESDAFLARLQFRSKVERAAAIAGPKWSGEITRLSEILDCKVRWFDLSERDEAKAWIGAN